MYFEQEMQIQYKVTRKSSFFFFFNKSKYPFSTLHTLVLSLSICLLVKKFNSEASLKGEFEKVTKVPLKTLGLFRKHVSKDTICYYKKGLYIYLKVKVQNVLVLVYQKHTKSLNTQMHNS